MQSKLLISYQRSVVFNELKNQAVDISRTNESVIQCAILNPDYFTVIVTGLGEPSMRSLHSQINLP